MRAIDLNRFTDTFMSRTGGLETSMKIVDLLEKELDSWHSSHTEFIKIRIDEDKMISFSFLDEIVKRLNHYFSNKKQKPVFFFESGEKSRVYEKLARISGLRNLKVYFRSAASNEVHEVVPKPPSPLPEFQFEEKPE